MLDRGENFDLADLERVSILRALLADPDVLLLADPFEKFNREDARLVMFFLRKWVNSGGHELFLPHKRRPRTIFFTEKPRMIVEEMGADCVECVDAELWLPDRAVDGKH